MAIYLLGNNLLTPATSFYLCVLSAPFFINESYGNYDGFHARYPKKAWIFKARKLCSRNTTYQPSHCRSNKYWNFSFYFCCATERCRHGKETHCCSFINARYDLSNFMVAIFFSFAVASVHLSKGFAAASVLLSVLIAWIFL